LCYHQVQGVAVDGPQLAAKLRANAIEWVDNDTFNKRSWLERAFTRTETL